MSLISDINDVVCEYTRKNGKTPTSISIGINGKNELDKYIDYLIPVHGGKCENGVIYGLKVKWVKRNNYIECLPRPKRFKIKGHRCHAMVLDDYTKIYGKIQTN